MTTKTLDHFPSYYGKPTIYRLVIVMKDGTVKKTIRETIEQIHLAYHNTMCEINEKRQHMRANDIERMTMQEWHEDGTIINLKEYNPQPVNLISFL